MSERVKRHRSAHAWRGLAPAAVGLAFALLVGACEVTPTPTTPTLSPAPATASDGSASASSVAPPSSIAPSEPVVVGSVCSITQAPGPADAPPADGSEIDTSNDGPGRWRLCLTEPTLTAVEHSAWCRWNADRTRVDEVSGVPTTGGSVDFDAWLSFTGSKFEVHLNDSATGLIASYAPLVPPNAATDPNRLGGTVPVDVALVVDPEAGSPAGAPLRVVGQMRWLCGEPPPPAWR